MIKPTVGRIVWYTPGGLDLTQMAINGDRNGAQPMAAIVAYVWSDTMVNLTVSDHNGTPHSRTSVPLLQDGDTRPPLGHFAEWMPYQKGQAAKPEQLEQKLGASS